MEQPNKLIVQATVFSLDNPDVRIVDAMTGTDPHETAEIPASIETVLHTLGNKALIGGHLSIDYVVSRQNFQSHPYGGQTVNKAVVVAKAVDRTKVSLTDSYQWSDGHNTPPVSDE